MTPRDGFFSCLRAAFFACHVKLTFFGTAAAFEVLSFSALLGIGCSGGVSSSGDESTTVDIESSEEEEDDDCKFSEDEEEEDEEEHLPSEDDDGRL